MGRYVPCFLGSVRFGVVIGLRIEESGIIMARRRMNVQLPFHQFLNITFLQTSIFFDLGQLGRDRVVAQSIQLRQGRWSCVCVAR